MGPEKGLYLLCSDRDRDWAAAGLISFPEGGKPSCPHALSGSRVAVQCAVCEGPGIERENGGGISNPRATSEPNHCRVE